MIPSLDLFREMAREQEYLFNSKSGDIFEQQVEEALISHDGQKWLWSAARKISEARAASSNKQDRLTHLVAIPLAFLTTCAPKKSRRITP